MKGYGRYSQAYKKAAVSTVDQRKLIVMLYDGVIRYLRKAVIKMDAADIEGAHNYLVRSREILAELLSTLKPEKGGEVGENLRRLYAYAFNRIIEANLHKDPQMAEEVIEIMSTLREGWVNIKPSGVKGKAPSPEQRKVNLTT